MLYGYAILSIPESAGLEASTLTSLGVCPRHIFFDYGFSGTRRGRPGLARLFNELRTGDEIVVTKLCRLSTSIQGLARVAHALQEEGVRFNLNGRSFGRTRIEVRLLIDLLDELVKFESELSSLRTKEGMARAKGSGKPQGRRPTLTTKECELLADWYTTGGYDMNELAEMFGIARSTAYRCVRRAADARRGKH